MYGDTAFNSWPVPLVPLAGLPKATQHVHDEIFENDMVADSGAEDGTGSAAVEDLGDKVIPFPREMSEMLTREMIHVFAIDVGIFLTPASGKALMAVILENRRAVAICKNKAQRDFIMQQLLENVKALNLAADRRPAKPQELVEWESTHGRTGPQAAGSSAGNGRAGGAVPPAPVAPLLGGTPAAVPPPLPTPGASPQLPTPAVPPQAPKAAWGSSAFTDSAFRRCFRQLWGTASASSDRLGGVWRGSVAMIAADRCGLLRCWGVLLGNIASNGTIASVGGLHSGAMLLRCSGVLLGQHRQQGRVCRH